MSKRLTHTRIDKWDTTLMAVNKRLEALANDVQAYRGNAKGGRYQMLTNLIIAIDTAAEHISLTGERVEHVRRHEAAKSVVAS